MKNVWKIYGLTKISFKTKIIIIPGEGFYFNLKLKNLK